MMTRSAESGENYVEIRKLVNEPIVVNINKNFVISSDEAGDGSYWGITPEFTWKLYKNVIRDWKYILGKLLDPTVGLDSYSQRIHSELKYGGVGKTTSNNYRIDNVSSVYFGNKPFEGDCK